MKAKPRLQAGAGLVASLLAAAIGVADAAELLTDQPDFGDAVRYFDIDARGRILDIDYQRRNARVVAQLPMDAVQPGAMVSGWYLPDEQFAYLLVSEDMRATKLCVFDEGSGQLRDTNIEFNPNLDMKMVPLTRSVLYFQFGDGSRPKSKGILDGVAGAVKWGYEFDLTPDTFCSLSLDQQRFYAFPRPRHGGTTFFGADMKTGLLLSEWDLNAFFSSSEGGGLLVRHIALAGMSGPVALARVLNEGDHNSHYVLLDLDKAAVLACSEQVPYFNGRFHLALHLPKEVTGYCIVEGVEGMVTGLVRPFQVDVSDGRFVFLDPVEFDPTKEIALRTGEGEIRVLPRCAFDYVSMHSLHREWGKWVPKTPEEREQRVTALEAGRRDSLGTEISVMDSRGRLFKAELQHLEIEGLSKQPEESLSEN